ncbi:hypothetical protein CPB84DRAFT_1968115 [Gymnopilus junonius]|uniref:DUF5648 domain-containing protein n=1 Tax=Gymnopilus junonius TaxID=109634 RepID=A0A9P5TFC3_GYMJU|nr:hypothetical protein CPB84DRAFT_1968115 [Gymnopilus junonius]
MKGSVVFFGLAVLFKGLLAESSGINSTTAELEGRTANTCADPGLALPFRQWFSISQKAHVLDQTIAIVNANTAGGDWTWQADSFLAWGGPQEFVFPLYVFFNPTTADNLYVLSSDGTVPSVSGTIPAGIVAYVYATQVCGSVPLFSVAQEGVGDHWYTTSNAERDALTSVGWVSEGVIAFVLPIQS